ncbi:hypothetical protein EMIHUDRAFT_99647 [Emiliania huxleyi CCMP1516]|uniref:Uncharacterized protein n=2 Tax=Emiliania huxleyi TaxID=2903 RepID=A0A0D3JNI6_EMIH1|nr:hypothetical protein EMIHUDRAFT_206150 [Emiliania huxleyi CCMP1516]XP_005781626.1 hypothetical protein EMIHUDRAFT_99647 [Emiliania huxleyi CCMP1516]EOD25071.1 hypothetical protein EMIHUDRAFT_206150 [Emiliania huxleyi CCMP1516]EOD29197.1 hypothetical protein EMIHUDRAFT_99647 [Emiliania huxleyi CCMP1516]|eukprot:XP_005777500.1 hypothetical protein EMIHUDRAFT_206150 [Emiliania huxleyi CCMP1516]
MSGLPSRRASRGAELGIGSPVANARARDKVTPDKALRTDEAWAAKEELIRYYEVARASPSTTRPKLPKAVRDDKHTIFSIPGERGMIATLVDIFTDHNIAQLVLFLVDRPDFVDAVESAFLDGLHACGAADAVLERAAGLAHSVLRTDTAGLVELLKAPGSCTESTRLAWDHCSFFDLHYLRLDLLLCIERRAEEWQVLPTRTSTCYACAETWSAKHTRCPTCNRAANGFLRIGSQ